MAQVTAANIIALGKTLKTQFFSALEKADVSVLDKLATKVPSDNADEDYGWLGNVPGISEFVDERQIKGITEYSYNLKNKKWEGTIGVAREDFEDEKTGQIKIRTQDLAVRAANHPAKLLLNSAVPNGATELAYDGQYFYDTDHAYTGGAEYTTNQSNKLTGTGTSLAQIKADFTAARKALQQFKDDRGELFHEMPLKLIMMVPPDLQVTAEELLNATEISNTTNVLKGAAELLVNPYLSDTNDWYLFNVGSYLKPFVYQVRKEIEWYAIDDPNNSESVFMRDKFYFGTRARYNVGYGFWQNAVLTTNT